MKASTKRALLIVGGVAVVGGVVYVVATSSPKRPASYHPTGLSWGATVSPEFRARVMEIGKELAIDPSFLMAIMRAESGINPHIHIIPVGKNAKGGVIYKRSFEIPIEEGTIGGGLIGFMKGTAKSLGLELGQLLALDGVNQLEYVRRFYANHQKSGVLPRNPSLWRLYMSTFYPAKAHLADEPEAILFDSQSGVAKERKAYFYNSTADRDQDGDISIAEAMAKIDGIMRAGLKKGRVF